MEAMNEVPGEEYILAMRTTAYRDDSDLWRERRSEPLKAGLNKYGGRKKTKTKGLLPMTDDHTAKVLASLVPDEIIYNVNDYSNRVHQACMLFGDVSGFTDLCEMYNKSGKGGPSRLTVVLNGYIGSMVQEIMSHNGDILSFSGDAFLAMYKCRSQDSLQDVVHEALDAAIMIQKCLGTYETDVGVFLRVKLAISAGTVFFSLLGDAKSSYYVIVGQPILDVKAAEKKASAGEIIVTASAWNHANSNEYQYDQLPDKIHTKVKGVALSWRPSQRNMERGKMSDTQEQEPVDFEIVSSSSRVVVADFDGADTLFEDKKQGLNFLKSEDVSLRPSVNYAARMNLKNDLRKFIIPSVMRGIDLDEPIEYLTEMRQIVIVFINIITLKMEWEDYIQLIDSIYKIVSSVVAEMQGCVNKLSTFDKDLMIVLLFGLRGYKNEYESQIGLRCASECYFAISKLPSVTSTSIGVTTGMTYCGVVGHVLRREYTVIGLSVNKAARLMCAYPNKVTCDRETFLHSKLEAKNFILQEYKPLKGIGNVGPIYEFKEQAKDTGVPTINLLPLLGRNDEVQLYLNLIHQSIEIKLDRGKTNTEKVLDHCGLLAIYGEARIGKTRLLDECVFLTPADISINRFTLTKHDGKIPYQTIEYLFCTPLGLTGITTSVEREAKLKLHLQKLQIPGFLCALNKVFNVNFENTSAYLTLTNEEKLLVLEKILKQLCYLCFSSLWLIAIDDADFIDSESWKFLNTMLDIDLVFFVITLSAHKELCPEASVTLRHNSVKTIEIGAINKWFHAGLACQILDVQAISPELEKLIQTRSKGNPGWMESFLVSLVQAGALTVKRLAMAKINELGLISPPINMIMRMPTNELQECKDDVDTKKDDWKMYKHGYRESVVNEMKAKIRSQKNKFEGNIPVCVVSSNFKLEDIAPELPMNVMIIKLFDSLTSYEQLMLKCSSVLGDYFPRDMLVYIMGSTIPRDMALAVQKLFELRVLGCARGDFSEGVACMMFTQRLAKQNQDNSPRCDCRALMIHNTCYDLPKYASCGYLRFKGTMFRETTYNLLTDNQKKEFHTRAIRYIEKKTRRCRSCGNGMFVKILGSRYDDGFTRKSRQSRKSGNGRRSTDKPTIKTSRSSRLSTATQRNSSGVHQDQRNYDTSSAATKSSITTLRRETMASKYVSSHSMDSNTSTIALKEIDNTVCFPLRTINRLKHSLSLTRTFSYADFSSCQCPLILNTMYNQIIEHCKGAGLNEKMVDALLEYSYICIMSYNIPHAMKILHEAQVVVEQMALTVNYEIDLDADWKFPIVRGKIETLLGHARLELGQMEDAYLCFQQALVHYGFKFPTKMIAIKLRTLGLELKQRLGMYFLPSLLSPTSDEYEAQFCDNVSDCLALLCRLFKEVQMWDQAELAASWSLNKSLQSDMDFYGLCTAYANMLEVAGHLGKDALCVALEVNALKLCYRKRSSVEIQELKAVASLYVAVFINRIMRAEIEAAAHIGYILLRISENIHAINISVDVIPVVVQVLMIRNEVMEAVTILMELNYYASEDIDNSGKTWFFALGLTFQIETGYSVVSYVTCDSYYQVERDSLVHMRDPDAERRFYTVMWLWCIRNEQWEAASVWYTKICNFPMVYKQDSLNNMFTALYLLEGLLLYLVGKMDKRNIEEVIYAYEEIDSLLKAIEDAGEMARIILPRLYHLKAYYKFIKSEKEDGVKYIEKSKKLAEKHENMIEPLWIEHSKKAWYNNLPSIEVDFWKEHSYADNLLDYHEVELNDGQLGLYTLTLPTYL